VLLDGDQVGSILRVTAPAQAAVLDDTLMALPYDLLPEHPRVLLLGETGGVDAWLAARRGAAAITVVQRHPDLAALLRTRLPLPQLTVVEAAPRAFLERAADRYDLVQIVTLQGLAGGGGLGGLAQDHLLTVDGLAACLDRLSPGGVVAVTGGLQHPPRTTLRLVATLLASLEARGAARPGDQLAQARDYLAACTLASPAPWTAAQIARLDDAVIARHLTPVWYPGLAPDRLNRPDRLPTPPGATHDWYREAIVQLTSDRREAFLHDWAFDVRPPTDDRPFFHDCFRWGSLGELRRFYGAGWLGQVELGFPFLVAALLLTAALGALLTLLPLAVLRRRRPDDPGPRLATLLYFGSLGLGYLLLELACIGRLTHRLGDPVLAAALCIAGFLCCSGVGSLQAGRRPDRPAPHVRRIVLVVLLSGGAVTALGSQPLALLLLVPMAWAMGWLLPAGLRRLDQGTPALVPWAWAINGFASVVASTLAVVLAMTRGQTVVMVTALLLYALAGLVYPQLSRSPRSRGA
jgi:hypothetical protein